MADEPNFYDRLDAILDDCRAGHKHNGIVDALDALYGEQHAVTIGERDEARAEVKQLRSQLAALRSERDAAFGEVVRLRQEVARLRNALGVEVRRPGRSLTPSSSGVPDSVVRAWARERGIVHNPKGRVAAEIRDAYEAAWRAGQEDGRG